MSIWINLSIYILHNLIIQSCHQLHFLAQQTTTIKQFPRTTVSNVKNKSRWRKWKTNREVRGGSDLVDYMFVSLAAAHNFELGIVCSVINKIRRTLSTESVYNRVLNWLADRSKKYEPLKCVQCVNQITNQINYLQYW